ncbi:unnamed protein product [Leptosia nina]|uniref:Uncharacterized protein n=1 Tax=Leptosia nina TaxID=320188 RepID=A0AAV1JJN3_9NEOP
MNNLKTKRPLSEDLYPSKDVQDPSNCAPQEVFRNNTTAVEVIVKQVDMDILKKELLKANSNLEETRKSYKLVLCEIKKQLDAANERALKRQTQNVLLQFENEKVKTLLASKSNLVMKLKKELINMRRILKFVIRGIHFIPEFEVESDYAEFEKELKRSASLKNTKALDLDGYTFDSLFSTEGNQSRVQVNTRAVHTRVTRSHRDRVTRSKHIVPGAPEMPRLRSPH